MKKERWKVTAAVICILVCGIWYSRIYGTEQMQYKAAPVTETVEPIPAVININTADQEELMLLDGIGEKLAERILEYRTENGAFQTIEEIQNVKGIGEKTFADIAADITVE